MAFSSQEYQSGLPCPLPGDFPDPEIEPTSLTFPASAGKFFTFLVKEALVYSKGDAISVSVMETR